ncbi:hypothetical protein H9X57_07620 [Flavobacterium piscinae]|uniref:hypothetical protein n=1 Tax=Flavobacterium piscinae TaxID=2506424 RepID=UPI0019C847B0|nr:hypothetical protein [Flavobacterium piscinae]MBC8883347.1 hypothetical protein [Flavobacterium piscinae]
MIFILGILLIIALLYFVIFLPWLKQKKYQNPTYLTHLAQISLFFDTLDQLDDYVTWVHRDALKNSLKQLGSTLNPKHPIIKKSPK